jgi:hypothetical protein
MGDVLSMPGVAPPADNVVDLDVITSLPMPSEKLLTKALENGVTNVVILGYDPDGDFYFASSDADGGDVLWLLDIAKKRLLETAE